MTARRTISPLTAAIVIIPLLAAGLLWSPNLFRAEAAEESEVDLEASFETIAKPFLTQNCLACHNEENSTSGVRVDNLDGKIADNRLRLWQAIRRNLQSQTMPPKGLPQPADADREQMIALITQAMEVARSRPSPKNGQVRRLTVSQYRNTLQELLSLDDNVSDILPPDAISKDGFVNNEDTLELSPLLMESYFEVAEEALDRAIVNPDERPSIQNFRVDLGESINPNPLPEELILGANSMLLDNPDYLVTELTPKKPFPFEPFHMRTKYRFIEGYKGNATVRGWRDFDSIYHAVFADLRGSAGYPKGTPYKAIPQGLLLRPAIPNDELFGEDGTYGPKANFKISLRELPHHGNFRVTVTAAKYNDGLLLDEGDAPQAERAGAVVWRNPGKTQTLDIPKAGVYQVDVYEAGRSGRPAPDASHLDEGLSAAWSLDGDVPGELEGGAKLVDSPFGKALSLGGDDEALSIPQQEGMGVGTGDFTVSAWIHPEALRASALVVFGGYDQMPGWRLALGGRGVLRLDTTKADDDSNGSIASPPGAIRNRMWQHVAAVVKRGKGEAKLFVNGYLVAKGTVGPADLDNTKVPVHLGRLSYAQHFQGDLDEVRIYKRAIGEAELQALIEPGRSLDLTPPDLPQEMMLTLGGRPFATKTLEQPAFVAMRLDAGKLEVAAPETGIRGLDRVVLTPLAADHAVAQRFHAFEQRNPRIGVHLGFRRDCGSTFAPVGEIQTVSNEKLQKFVFEGAIQNYPAPDVEKDNVNYLAGFREIAVRSEYTDNRDMPRLLIRSVEFEGPFYDEWPPESHEKIFVEYGRKHDPAGYAREIVRNFAGRAYRRPVTESEESALMAVFERSLDNGGSFQSSIKDALLVALTSPQFLFLVETSQTPEPEQLSDYELASKLSYFLWNSPPDEKTLDLAAAGKLRGQLDAEVDRMVADKRFERFTNEFTSQWLQLDKFDVLEPNREKFPKLTREVRTALRHEPIATVEYLFEKNLEAKNLVSSDFILANEVTADYYGFPDKTESGFQFTPVVHGRPELGGLLSQAAILAGLSDGRESNPIKRGAWMARKIVAEPPPPPPPNVPALSADTEGLTLRQRLEQHRNQPGCMQCHSTIDPWGIALEEFDADGLIKKEPTDAHSTLPDKTEVADANDLKRYLSEDRLDQVAFSLLKHLETYANGRDLTYNELDYLRQDGRTLRDDGYRMRDMLHYVVNSKLFQEK
ncbi:MAG: DUF1592 domain-containing protein [Acidobacteria bacterium]|nr:DUF1592 domain-containing protein [Acidobacteriota bacterium]